MHYVRWFSFPIITIVIKNNDTEIKRINKLYLLPAEMENIKLDLKNVEDGKLSLEVTHNE